MIIQAIRSAIFYAFFFIETAILAAIVALFTLVPPISKPVSRACANLWLWLAKAGLFLFVGIRVNVEGQENIPEQGVIIAAKHQSDLDILALYEFFHYPSFIAKSQLFQIPLFGRALKVLNVIRIDRKSGGKGMRDMVRDAGEQIAKGQFIFIFPEGTRKAPLDEPNYKFGVIKMYKDLEIPILPIALDTGLYWGRNSLVLWPGTAQIRILPPIPTGLSSEQAAEKLQAAIETETNALILDAVDKGLSRPITPQLQERITHTRNLRQD